MCVCLYETRAYVLTTPFHVAKMANHDDNAHSLLFLDDILAAREEDEDDHMLGALYYFLFHATSWAWATSQTTLLFCPLSFVRLFTAHDGGLCLGQTTN